ncbi:MAG: glutathione peroxidase [Saprospiraceae bacterium]|nr:glutathione peroxidase [Saprospiraceae bacterium]
MASIHSISVPSIEGSTLNFSDFKGKKIMVVNVASECGYTPQYEQLQELYNHFPHKLVIIGVPCNDFGGQEPDNEVTIQQFCSLRYGVTFPLTAKLGILKNTHSLYEFLTKKVENGVEDSEVRWNFQKYLLNTEGVLEKVLPSSVSPLDDSILNWVSA